VKVFVQCLADERREVECDRGSVVVGLAQKLVEAQMVFGELHQFRWRAKPFIAREQLRVDVIAELLYTDLVIVGAGGNGKTALRWLVDDTRLVSDMGDE
jgi:hypothetical protein